MIVQFNELETVREKYKDKTIVLGSGVFDLIHRGHVDYIQNLKKHGEIVVVMVKNDERVHLGKGSARPVIPEQDRVFMVDALKGVDIAFIGPRTEFSKEAPDPLYKLVFETLQPDIFYTTNPIWEKLRALNGPEIIIEERIKAGEHASTTEIIEKIKAQK